MTIDLPQPRLSESDAEVRYARNRRDATAMLALADHRMLAKDWRGAMRWYGAVDYLASQGGPVSMLDRRRTLEAIDWLKARFRDVLLRELDAVGLTRAERHPRFQKSLDIMLGIRPRDQADHAWPQLPQTYFYPDLPLVDFADTAQFDWREALEGQTGPILDEALGLAVMLISHDLGVVASICQRVMVMYAGTVVEEGPTRDFLRAPAHPYSRGLVASVPRLRSATRPAGIPGQLPNLLSPPPGCRFAPRCPQATPRCTAERPALREVEPGRRVACHHAEAAA